VTLSSVTTPETAVTRFIEDICISAFWDYDYLSHLKEFK